MVGATAADDAAVYRLTPERALVATVDFFTPIVDDAAAFGAIAAANSLSDVYAMGATPLFALSLVAFPRHLLKAGLLAPMVAAGASAATDVTGYGLLGHLANLGCGADIDVSSVPVLPGVRRLAADGLFPAGTRRNYEALESQVEWDGLPEPERLLMCDAQTSGGLLVALHPERASAFVAGMAGAPYPATRIGVGTDGPI